jgi:hypothetical protein
MSWIRRVVVIGVVTIMVIGGLLVSGVLAAPNTRPEAPTHVTTLRTLDGIVTAYQANKSLRLRSTKPRASSRTQTVQIDTKTRIITTAVIPGEPLTLDLGDRVIVQMTQSANGSDWVASWVRVLPTTQQIHAAQRYQLEKLPDAIRRAGTPTK